jgi:hypothetical protein
MSDTESNSTINEEINEINEEIADGEPTKSLQKPKKPRTEAQIKALEKAQVKRAENIEKRKKEKELAKLEKQQEKLNKKKSTISEATINPSNNGFNEDISTEDLIKQNEELLKKLALKNINKKPKAKKPAKQTIIYESESSDSSSSEEEEIIIKKKPKHKKKPRQAKKVVYQSESSSEESEEEQVTKKLQRQKSVKPQYEEEQYYEPQAPRQRLKYSDVFRFK